MAINGLTTEDPAMNRLEGHLHSPPSIDPNMSMTFIFHRKKTFNFLPFSKFFIDPSIDLNGSMPPSNQG